MAGTILVAYGTKHGSTREVACAVSETLAEHGLDVDTLPAERVADVARYDGVVVGGALYTGRWHPDAVRFLERHRTALAAMPVAVFGMGPRTMDEHDADESRGQLLKALTRVPDIEPVEVAVFGGVIDPRSLRFPFNRLPASDARNWSQIRAWATEVCDAFAFGKAASDTRDPRRELQRTHR
jgi:menaquinone-dependent protoporphyrinogen oxidase